VAFSAFSIIGSEVEGGEVESFNILRANSLRARKDRSSKMMEKNISRRGEPDLYSSLQVMVVAGWVIIAAWSDNGGVSPHTRRAEQS